MSAGEGEDGFWGAFEKTEDDPPGVGDRRAGGGVWDEDALWYAGRGCGWCSDDEGYGRELGEVA